MATSWITPLINYKPAVDPDKPIKAVCSLISTL